MLCVEKFAHVSQVKPYMFGTYLRHAIYIRDKSTTMCVAIIQLHPLQH